ADAAGCRDGLAGPSIQRGPAAPGGEPGFPRADHRLLPLPRSRRHTETPSGPGFLRRTVAAGPDLLERGVGRPGRRAIRGAGEPDGLGSGGVDAAAAGDAGGTTAAAGGKDPAFRPRRGVSGVALDTVQS